MSFSFGFIQTILGAFGELNVSGSGECFPCYELWRVVLIWANYSPAFHFTTLLQFKYFSRLYSKFVCLWFVFSGREGLYRWTNSILCPFILRDPFKWHVCTAGIAGGRWLGYLSPAKLIFLIFLLMDSGWGLALLGPRLFIFSLGRTACFCVKRVF